ncbi:hypothetical protein BGZ80_011145 [Entomortierella chlamydospora]|uniref:HTH CENPB-type domain-containing protein n=1 Tax=Entomortierella chlamydospora TaxID=101097 RepID=A0A9P6SZ82_9FUNG|nr:hypothetical protein BGZ80_011145 [Entomortierella chlamydospora]
MTSYPPTRPSADNSSMFHFVQPNSDMQEADTMASPPESNMQLDMSPGPETTNNGRKEGKYQGRIDITFSKKAAVIRRWKSDPLISKAQLAKECGIPRTTLYGIISRMDKYSSDDESQTRCRSRKPLFPLLEEAAVRWIKYRKTLGVSESDVRSIGIDVLHTMDRLLLAPQPPCKFSPSWIKGFNDRHSKSLETVSVNAVPSSGDKLMDFASTGTRSIEGSDRESIIRNLEGIAKAKFLAWLKNLNEEIGRGSRTAILLLIDLERSPFLDTPTPALEFVTVMVFRSSCSSVPPMRRGIMAEFEGNYNRGPVWNQSTPYVISHNHTELYQELSCNEIFSDGKYKFEGLDYEDDKIEDRDGDKDEDRNENKADSSQASYEIVTNCCRWYFIKRNPTSSSTDFVFRVTQPWVCIMQDDRWADSIFELLQSKYITEH